MPPGKVIEFKNRRAGCKVYHNNQPAAPKAFLRALVVIDEADWCTEIEGTVAVHLLINDAEGQETKVPLSPHINVGTIAKLGPINITNLFREYEKSDDPPPFEYMVSRIIEQEGRVELLDNEDEVEVRLVLGDRYFNGDMPRETAELFFRL